MRRDSTTIRIPLTRGKFAIIDAADAELISGYKWHTHRSGNQFYAAARVTIAPYTRRWVRMHRLIMNAPDHLVVDHINGDGLDNRRVNLRLATQQQNIFNRKKDYDNTSGFKGVECRTADMGLRCRARIRVNGKMIYLGTYGSAEEAARVYDAAAIEYYGEFACLNLPENGQRKA